MAEESRSLKKDFLNFSSEAAESSTEASATRTFLLNGKTRYEIVAEWARIKTHGQE